MPLWPIFFTSLFIAAVSAIFVDIPIVSIFASWFFFMILVTSVHFLIVYFTYTERFPKVFGSRYMSPADQTYFGSGSEGPRLIKSTLIILTDVLSPIGYLITHAYIRTQLQYVQKDNVSFDLVSTARNLVPSELIHSLVTACLCGLLLLYGYVTGFPQTNVVFWLFICLYVQIFVRILSYVTFRTAGQVFRRKIGNPALRFFFVVTFDVLSFGALIILLWKQNTRVEAADILTLVGTIPSTVPILKDIWTTSNPNPNAQYIVHVWLTLSLIIFAFGKYIYNNGTLKRKTEDIAFLAFCSGKLGNPAGLRDWALRMKEEQSLAHQFVASAAVQSGNIAKAYEVWQKSASARENSEALDKNIIQTMVLLSCFEVSSENWMNLAGYLARREVSDGVVTICIGVWTFQHGVRVTSELQDLEDDLERSGGYRLPLAKIENIKGNVGQSAKYLRSFTPRNSIEKLFKLTIYVESLMMRRQYNREQKNMIVSRVIKSNRSIVYEIVYSAEDHEERTFVLYGLIYFEALLYKMGVQEATSVSQTIEKSLDKYDLEIEVEPLQRLRDQLSYLINVEY